MQSEQDPFGGPPVLSRLKNLARWLKLLLIHRQSTVGLKEYVMSAPGPQNALDLFKGEWISELPGELAALRAGKMQLFEDFRIKWFMDQAGGVRGKEILELGPLEAGHTYMLERMGASSILSIEANPRNYLKCVIIKEVVGLNRARFLCGDFMKYLRCNEKKYDLCLACGVLYHMTDPAELIALLSRTTDFVCLWTHYYDREIIGNIPKIAQQFLREELAEYEGFKHRLYYKVYNQAELDHDAFCGGGMKFSRWMNREDILRCFRYFGLTEVHIAMEDVHHQNGPSFALTASRS